MAQLRGQRISVPAYCYPRYDYLSEKADILIKYFERIEGSAKFRRCLNQGEEKLVAVVRNGKTLKSKLNLFVFYEKADSDFLETNQFLVKNVSKEDKTEPVDISWEEFLALPKTTKYVDLSTVFIVVLSGELSEVFKEVEDSNIFTALPQQHTYFVSKDTKMCCKMEDISNLGQRTSNLGHLVQSGLEKSVMDVVKQMEQFMAELLAVKAKPINGNLLDDLRKHVEDLCYKRLLPCGFSVQLSYETGGQPMTVIEHNKEYYWSENITDFVLPRVVRKSSVTHHFLLKRLDFENALEKACTILPLPSFMDLHLNNKNVTNMFSVDFVAAISPLITSAKTLVTKLMVILERMRRLQFLTHALLRLSPLTCKDIKEPPPLPTGLQQDLIKKPFVTGCGTIFGELVIHVVSAISGEQKKDIEDCLGEYGSLCPYKVEICVPEWHKTAGQGDCIRAEKTTYRSDEEQYKHSSLGCFVDVKVKKRNQKDVHFITCHHCLNDCSDKVSVWSQNMEYEDLGLKKHSHKAADIALVQVMKSHLVSKGLKNRDDSERECDKWNFYQEGEYAGRQVYKVGATSKSTKGVIVSDNYLMNPKFLDDELPPNLFLIVSYSVLDVPSMFRIETEEQGAGAADAQHPFFSYEGDSGSVVCDMNPDSGDGLVLGLLQGVVHDKNNPEHYIYSYASNMKSALNMLKEKHPDIESIEPSLDQEQFPGAY